MPCPYFTMYQMSIDPGVNTGVVVCGDELVYQATFRNDIIASIRELIKRFGASRMDVIVESAPAHGDKRQIERVERVVSVLREYFSEDYIHMVSPGHWKSLAKARGWAKEITGSVHVKDAYCMLRYYRITIKR